MGDPVNVATETVVNLQSPAAPSAPLELAVIGRPALAEWTAALQNAGWRVVAPVTLPEGTVEYRLLEGPAAPPSGLARGIPRSSPKEAWFPRSEPILHLKREGRSWIIVDPVMEYPRTVVFGARPCDASAPQVLAPLFGWDFHDPFFERRLAGLVFVTMGCAQAVDEACFCQTVGIDPAGVGVGDVVLTEMSDDRFLATVQTEKGREILAALTVEKRPPVSEAPLEVAALREKARASISNRFDPQRVRVALEQRFADPMWEKSARACISCGTCAFTCPTCHCFDIQDEVTGSHGIRQKNWDSCQFPLFTLHTSGHNPRATNGTRWRQRLSHKFRYYPEKFEHTLCTGCGRCMRLCPAGMDLLGDLSELSKSAVMDESPPRPVAEGLPVAGVQASSPASSPNIYRPYLMRVASVVDETPDVRTLRLEFVDEREGGAFSFRVGQFGLYSALGEGEATFCIASSSTRKGYIECTFRQAGRVTKALRRLEEGDLMGFRGPYGNSFPVESWKGRDLLFIAGGIALPPMRSVIAYCLDNRDDYGDITIVYGARTSADHVYKDEQAEWLARPDVNLWRCIDWRPGGDGKLAQAEAEPGWRPLDLANPGASVLDERHRCYTGFVPHLLEAVKPSPDNRVAVVCGPPIMIKITLGSLEKLGYGLENVYTTLENRMKCGLGKCGRCNVGPIYLCKEGPVYTARQVQAMPAAEM